jgi:hypothetical protein
MHLSIEEVRSKESEEEARSYSEFWLLAPALLAKK